MNFRKEMTVIGKMFASLKLNESLKEALITRTTLISMRDDSFKHIEDEEEVTIENLLEYFGDMPQSYWDAAFQLRAKEIEYEAEAQNHNQPQVQVKSRSKRAVFNPINSDFINNDEAYDIDHQ
jgi:hypothetical protein